MLIFNLPQACKPIMTETFGQRIGAIAAVLLLILVFTGVGIVTAPALSQMLEFLAVLDIILLVFVAGITVVVEVKERLIR